MLEPQQYIAEEQKKHWQLHNIQTNFEATIAHAI